MPGQKQWIPACLSINQDLQSRIQSGMRIMLKRIEVGFSAAFLQKTKLYIIRFASFPVRFYLTGKRLLPVQYHSFTELPPANEQHR
jgi:hypothetical protein